MDRWIRDYVKAGATVVDIGANVGEVAEWLHEAVGPDGRLIAIEPQAELVEEIHKRAPRATVLTMAAGDHEDIVLLYHSEQTPHASLYAENILLDAGRAPTPVRLASLDGLQTHGELPTPIHAIKIDAQGAEVAILRGATRLLREQRPILYVELWPLGLERAGASTALLCETLQAAGYRPEGRTWDEVVQHSARCREHASDDVLCVPVEQENRP